MTTVPPSLAGDPRVAADKAVARAVGVARVSSTVMLVLGVASVAACVTAPLSASFLISVAVVVNGWIERRAGRELAAHVRAAPARLAWNQVALGCEVMAYAAWQAHAIHPAQLEAVLRRPFVARFLALLDPAVLEQMLEQLPVAVRVTYLVVGGATLLGCLATALYFGTRVRALRILASNTAER